MDSGRVPHAPLSPASSETQSSALARIYARAIQRFQEKEGYTAEDLERLRRLGVGQRKRELQESARARA
jgi:hypothetical protein